ncbi:excinuclease ABC subunit UvrA [Lihuaxuella thermophila]|uniref:UvrABC system protein A n=1 Tax=Lihuaxuella thermophila TaxID=1173111 RepID=A0A1H8CU49_9BACL|nr:excinuclease ABC subunit UvrA [Lihuaxuella thermophila]SEM97858.1 excinuclease ABC subunit A [Lihuaxuella thermophila]
MQGKIQIVGAWENNLKRVSVEIPKYKFVVVTGPSGSGKSTLVMDTLQRECQRLYMESMGMVSDSISKPKVDAIHGLSPSISVGQHATNRNPRSTIGTVTDIYTLMRILYAKIGERPCPSCGELTPPSIAMEESPVRVWEEENAADQKLTEPCAHCGHPLEKLTLSHFSFNKPEGACETCDGLGNRVTLNLDAVFDQEKSLREGAVLIWHDFVKDYQLPVLEACARYYGFRFDADLPLKDCDSAQRDLLYYGVESEEFSRHFPDVKPPKTVRQGKFEGVVTGIWRRYREKNGATEESKLFHEEVCPDCCGARIKKESRQVKVGGVSIAEVSLWSIKEAAAWMERLQNRLTPEQREVVGPVLREMLVRMKRLLHVGLGYLSLNRQVVSLSGGETQRLRLASVLDSGLTGVLYILDEPTAGLHPRDTRGLIQVLKQLRDLGNTVLVIEHDEEVMRAADHIIDMGPGAGSEGGEVVGQGRLEELMENPASITGRFLKEASRPAQRRERRSGNGHFLTIRDAQLLNLKNVTVSIPLGCLVSVTGVSGSGKSTLLYDVLAASYEKKKPIGCGGITGWEAVGNLITVDQSPIGRMQRSNIATYTEVYTVLRNWYAKLPEAKRRNLTSKHFSFNTEGGRCENCQGLGVVSVFMHFLPEMEVRCPVCRSRRFKEEILHVTYNGYSISDILEMTVQESLPVLADLGKITGTINLLCEVGLGYLKWGQSIRTLSGGEAQRIKLAKELSKKTKHHAVYLLDEPSTGLHPEDVRQLLVLLDKLVDAGNTVILVEHNLDLISESDWVIDLGPEGGEEGGRIMAEGTPEDLVNIAASHTGRCLKRKWDGSL